MKRILSILLILLAGFSVTACQSEEIWYFNDVTSGNAMNTITVKKTDSDHIHVTAECQNGANTGCFEEDFTLIADDLAVFSSRNIKGNSYTVSMSFTDNKLIIKVEHSNCDTEAETLWLGDNLSLSGIYTKDPPDPDYNYAGIVMEKVFHSDIELANEVEETLGEKEYAIFIHDFGMSTYIYEDTKIKEQTVIKGKLNGLGDWCGFYCDPGGYFYGVYNHKCFSNDPVYQNNPPQLLMPLY